MSAQALGARRGAGVHTGAAMLRGRIEQRLLVLVTLALVAFGLVMIFSATSASAALGNGDPMTFLVKQSLYAVAGLVLLAAMSRFDYHGLRPLAPVLLVCAFGLCLAVLVFAPAVNGARRWFVVGPVSVQPSEFAKLALCLWICARLARRPAPRTLGELLKPIGIVTALFCGAIILEPDLGTTIAMALMVGGVLLVSGIPMRLFVFASTLALGLGAAAIWGEPYRRARFFSFLNPTADPQGAGYQIHQAMIGVGSGRISGVGLGDGPQSSFYLPEAHTDMIAATIGEELGLIGLALLVAAFTAFAWAGFRVALTCRDPFGKRLAAGVTTLVCGQAVINLAAVLGVAPLTGIPLPFVSYGGSSLIVLLTAVGVLLNIAVNERVVEGRVRDRRRGDGRARPAGARRRGSAARSRGDSDVRRVSGSRRVAAGS
jgi:cell division protein FtsW